MILSLPLKFLHILKGDIHAVPLKLWLKKEKYHSERDLEENV